MGRKVDLTGKVFGRLTVIKECEKRKNGSILWLCKCECGNTAEVKGINLTSQKTKSCGCISKEKGLDIDSIIGKTYNEFCVLEFTGRSKHYAPMFKCKCSCGNVVEVNGYNLLSGLSTNCGCKRKETLSKIRTGNIVNKKFNSLTVLRKTDERNNFNKALYECECDCGNIIKVTSCQLTTNHTKSCGCKISQNNALVIKVITDLGYEVLPEYFIYPKNAPMKYLRLDAYIPSLNVAIEYDGEQHFFPVDFGGYGEAQALINFNLTKERDYYKDLYCKENGIELLRIPYYEQSRIKEIIKNFLSPTTTERKGLINNDRYATV